MKKSYLIPVVFSTLLVLTGNAFSAEYFTNNKPQTHKEYQKLSQDVNKLNQDKQKTNHFTKVLAKVENHEKHQKHHFKERFEGRIENKISKLKQVERRDRHEVIKDLHKISHNKR